MTHLLPHQLIGTFTYTLRQHQAADRHVLRQPVKAAQNTTVGDAVRILINGVALVKAAQGEN
jgi:hypothetical protein